MRWRLLSGLPQRNANLLVYCGRGADDRERPLNPLLRYDCAKPQAWMVPSVKCRRRDRIRSRLVVVDIDSCTGWRAEIDLGL